MKNSCTLKKIKIALYTAHLEVLLNSILKREFNKFFKIVVMMISREAGNFGVQWRQTYTAQNYEITG